MNLELKQTDAQQASARSRIADRVEAEYHHVSVVEGRWPAITLSQQAGLSESFLNQRDERRGGAIDG